MAASADITVAARPSRRHWYMAGVLCFGNTVAFIDRASLPLLVQSIERELNLSDTQMSLLIGFAFILAYSGFGLPAGMLVDRFSRRLVMCCGVLLWAFSTMFCGVSSSFAQLFIGRVGVGAGESVTGPASMSMIKNTFTRAHRGRAIAIWAMGASIGSGVALLAGAGILHLVGDAATVEVPILGTIRSWQLVLIISGLLALPLAVLLFTFAEPPRIAEATEQGVSLRDALRFMGSRWKIFVPLFLVNGAGIIMTASYGAWMPAVLGRVWHLPRPEIGFKYGLITLLLSTSSQFLAGLLLDRLGRRAVATAIPKVGIMMGAASLLPAVMAPIMPSLNGTWIALGVFSLVATCLFTIGTAAITHLAPTAMVGKITAIHFVWIGIMGTAVGPTLVASISDLFFAGPGALAQALSAVEAGLVAVVVSGYSVLLWQMRSRSGVSQSALA